MSIGVSVDRLYNVYMPDTEVKKRKKIPQKILDNIERKKEEFKKHYRELPNLKLSAGKTGVSKDSIYYWMEHDPIFATQLQEIKYDFALKNISEVRSKEWVLERVLREDFSPRQEITGADGKDLANPILVQFLESKPNEDKPKDNSDSDRV